MLNSLIDSFLNIFKKPYTLNYPTEKVEHPENYRGLIVYNEEYCIFCDKCEKVCPPNAIHFFQNMDGTRKYDYNPYLCIYCGECVRACPKPDEALTQSEKKPQPATKEDMVNSKWFEYQKECKESRVKYADFKKAKKVLKD